MPSCRQQEYLLNGEAMARSVAIDAASNRVRRTLGPTSWMVLEELLLRSSGASNECVARVSVRALAASLGLAKDTAARAIRRLRSARLVTAAQERTNAGIFDIAAYRITVPDGIELAASVLAAPEPCARIGRGDSSQLSFAIES